VGRGQFGLDLLARDGGAGDGLVLVVCADDGVSGDFLFDLDGHDAVPGVLVLWGMVRVGSGEKRGPHPNPSPALRERGFELVTFSLRSCGWPSWPGLSSRPCAGRLSLPPCAGLPSWRPCAARPSSPPSSR